jgi:two-component system cell cycle sensor histidine kinase/response regulator CckA
MVSEARTREDCILVVAPTGRDALLIGRALAAQQFSYRECCEVVDLSTEITAGAGAAILCEEALLGTSLQPLLLALQAQPAWSDFPMILLSVAGSRRGGAFDRLLAVLGEQVNLTILERPIRNVTLISSVRVALRSRRRQYQVREYLAEKAQQEQHMLQTQKLESLGVLAGGIAHDFNNLLVGILGNVSLALETITSNNPAGPMLRDAIAASETAAHLTRQLLAYAGKGRFVLEVVDLSAVVQEIRTLVQSSIPRTVQLRLDLQSDLARVEADLSQVKQLIMNLIINGAEAIPDDKGGTVTVTTRAQQVDEEYIRTALAPAELQPGTYVTLEVHDTGIGMTTDVIARIFDPFFTTKFTGRGLGLAAVLGIVQGHKGALKVYSTPGRGTTFKVLFPAAIVEAQPPAASVPQPLRHTSATVLVIDDEAVVRRTAKSMLERFGYTVVCAEDGKEGVEVFRVLTDKVSVVLLDMTMPVMSGEETFRELRAIKPDIRVVLSSGYNEVEAIRRFTGKGLAGFLQKPYSVKTLADKIQSVLEESEPRTHHAE